MTTRITNRLLGIAGAIVVAVLMGGLLFVGTANAQGHRHGDGSAMHGMMGYGMGATTSSPNTTPYVYPNGDWDMHGMGHGMGATTPVTDTAAYGYDHGRWEHGMMSYGMDATTSITDTTPYAYQNGGWCMHGMMGYGIGATTPVTDTTVYGYHHHEWGHGMMGSGR